MLDNKISQYLDTSSQQPKLWYLSLSQLLLLHERQDIYALAVAKARQQVLTSYLVTLLEQLVDKEGEKWLEVVRRLVGNNYRDGFQFGRNVEVFMSPLIVEYYAKNRGGENAEVYGCELWNMIKKSMQVYNDRKQEDKQLAISNLQCYIQCSLNHNDTQVQQQLFLYLSHNYRIVEAMLSCMDLNHYKNQLLICSQQQYNNNSNNNHSVINAKLWKLHYSTIQLFLQLVKLFEKMEDTAVRKINVRRYRELLGLDHGLGEEMGLAGVVEKYMKIMVRFMQMINVSVKVKNDMMNQMEQQCDSSSSKVRCGFKPFEKNNQQPWIPILSFLLSQASSTLTNYYTDLFQILLHFTRIAALQQIISRNPPLLDFIAEIIKKINIVEINRYLDTQKQMVALNSQVAHKVFSDTLAGTVLRTIVSLCNNIGPFFRYYFSSLYDQYKNDDIVKMLPTQFASYLLKINLLSYQDVMIYHQEKIQQLVLLLTQIFIQRWKNYDEVQQVQILRFFMIFVGVDLNSSDNVDTREEINYGGRNRGLGISQSAEELVKKCMNLCFQFLCSNSSTQEELSSYEELSPIQHQCLDILKSLPKSPNTLHIIKSSLLPTLLNIFMNLPNYSLIYLQLVNEYIKNIPELVSRSSTSLINYYHNAFIRVRSESSRSTYRNTDMQKIFKILHNIHAILQAESQIGFEDIEDKIVGPILSTLYEFKQCNYEQDMLSILEVLLSKHHHFTYQICIILSKLPILYERNNKKLCTFRNLYLALSISPSIIKQITYEYSNIILMMLQIFTDYISNVLSIKQFSFYHEEITCLLWNVQIFMQVYTIKIMEDQKILKVVERLFEGVSQKVINIRVFLKEGVIGMMGNSGEGELSSKNMLLELYEVLIQYLMTIAHICVDPRASAFNAMILHRTLETINQTGILNYSYFETIKMIPIILIDQLFISSSKHEQVIKQILNYCERVIALKIQGGIGKKWRKIQNFDQWKQWPKQTKQYIENVLKELKNRKEMDQVDYMQYMEALEKLILQQHQLKNLVMAESQQHIARFKYRYKLVLRQKMGQRYKINQAIQLQILEKRFNQMRSEEKRMYGNLALSILKPLFRSMPDTDFQSVYGLYVGEFRLNQHESTIALEELKYIYKCIHDQLIKIKQHAPFGIFSFQSHYTLWRSRVALTNIPSLDKEPIFRIFQKNLTDIVPYQITFFDSLYRRDDRQSTKTQEKLTQQILQQPYYCYDFKIYQNLLQNYDGPSMNKLVRFFYQIIDFRWGDALSLFTQQIIPDSSIKQSSYLLPVFSNLKNIQEQINASPTILKPLFEKRGKYQFPRIEHLGPEVLKIINQSRNMLDFVCSYCLNIYPLVENPYIRAVCYFLGMKFQENAKFEQICNNQKLGFMVRFLFSRRFLMPDQFGKFCQKFITETKTNPKLEYIMLSKNKLDIIEILSQYWDTHPNELERVALTCGIVLHKLGEGFKEDFGFLEKMVKIYEGLLKVMKGKQIHKQYMLKMMTVRSSKQPIEEQLIVKPQFRLYCELRKDDCVFLSMMQKFLLDRDEQKWSKLKNKSTQMNQLKKHYQVETTNCPYCNYPTPRCSVCLEQIKIFTVKSFLNQEIKRKLQNKQKPYMKLNQCLEQALIWCPTCGHGGHFGHLEKWFKQDKVCPVYLCQCKCKY